MKENRISERRVVENLRALLRTRLASTVLNQMEAGLHC